MKYVYLFSLIICVTFCSAQNVAPKDSTKATKTGTHKSTVHKSAAASTDSTKSTHKSVAPKKSSPVKTSTAKSAPKPPVMHKNSTVRKTNAPKAPAMPKDSAKKSAVPKDSSKKGSATEKGPGKGFGVSMTHTSAEYPGGAESLALFLQKNFKYAKQEQAKGKSGQVNVSFTVDKEGKIKDPVVLNGATKEVNDEAIRVVNMMPNWKPGMTGGSPVDVQYILPIDYFIPE